MLSHVENVGVKMVLLRVKARKETDAIRRAALQIAFQLPEDIDEARAVLSRASYLLENFLIVAPAALSGVPGAAATLECGAPPAFAEVQSPD